MADILISEGDFRVLSDALANDSVDLILTDPPYPREFLPLWGDLGRVAARVLKPGGYLVAYSGNMFIREAMTQLDHHLAYYWLIGVRHVAGFTSIFKVAMNNAWKPVLVYSKGEGRSHPWFVDMIRGGGSDKRYHSWGQPVGEAAQLIQTFSEPGDLVLDPFLGGGTVAVACEQTGRCFVGYEVDGAMAAQARARLAGCQASLFPARVLDTLSQVAKPATKMATCVRCGGTFPTGRADSRFCSDACRQAAYRRRRVVLQIPVTEGSEVIR